MFEAKIAKADTLKKIIEAIKDLVQEAPFDCAEGGMTLQAMDSSHVALVSLKLEAHGFDTFRCDRTQCLGVSLTHLSKIFKCAGNEDTATLRYGEDADEMAIVFDDPKRDKQQECVLKLLNLDTEHLGIPEQDYACKITMPSTEFQKAIRDLSLFTDTLCITATKSGVQLQGKGDSGSHTIRYGQGASADTDSDEVKIELSEPVNVTFAIKYMQHFIKATSLSSTVSLNISSEVPIVVEYPIENQGFLRYYLAPKIDDDDMPDN